MKVKYRHNNSGGGAGWKVRAGMHASKEFPSLNAAIADREHLTGESSSALGCSCCGVPHSFTAYDDNGDFVEEYSPSFPVYGEPYADR